jgi:preprotein translocase subunit SecG
MATRAKWRTLGHGAPGDIADRPDLALALGWPESPAADLASPGDTPLMLIQDESPAPAPAAVSGASQKLLQLIRKRLRQLARVTFVLAIGLALAATALAIWWLTSLNGLPDIGEPFDVAAFRAFSIPDDQNAFTFLRRADEGPTPMPGGTRAAGVSGVVSWSQADPKLRETST